ncbi:MAG: hypothetical protein HY295_01375 [Thaumarchaeota archaeon]|nr:hypothetical protein [Nitrososphaerota archaeon]
MPAETGNVKKALVAFAIERALLEIGKPALEKVTKQLYEEYQCNLRDCYEKPEILSKVLKNLYGKSYTAIVQSIRKELDDFADQKPIKTFLKVISQ